MDDTKPISLEQMRAFVAAGGSAEFQAEDRTEKYACVERTLRHLDYTRLSRADKGLAKQYLSQLTGLCRAQLTRLIGCYAAKGSVTVAPYQRRKFASRYTPADVSLLAYVDQAHGTLSGPATRRILQREYGEYHIEVYRRLAAISSAQIYRFRKTAEYRKRHTSYQPTRPTPIPIGERRKPAPNGRPGYLRIDTVHQGDQDGVKGLYHINAVDQVTQWQVVGAAPYISEAWLLPLLEAMLEQFPFRICSFHSDNGSEFINYQVSGLLNKLLIEQTKSRPRHSGDNALVESKNGAVIRKHLGWTHIASQHAEAVNQFHRQHLNPYLNFHRPCGIPELRTLARGKIKRVYRQWETPWDILRGLDDWETTLRTATNAAALQRQAAAQSDTDAAMAMQQAKRDLFRQLRRCSA
ncbi:MAG TPA: integrase [Candidatus Angelobacter sp.]